MVHVHGSGRDGVKDRMQGVFDTNEETRRLLGPTLLVYDSQLDHLAQLLTGVGQPADLRAEDLHPLIAGLLAARPVQKVQQQASDAADTLAQGRGQRAEAAASDPRFSAAPDDRRA
jgi:hypothetical protein